VGLEGTLGLLGILPRRLMPLRGFGGDGARRRRRMPPVYAVTTLEVVDRTTGD
jgi:hypothetical protein